MTRNTDQNKENQNPNTSVRRRVDNQPQTPINTTLVPWTPEMINLIFNNNSTTQNENNRRLTNRIPRDQNRNPNFEQFR